MDCNKLIKEVLIRLNRRHLKTIQIFESDPMPSASYQELIHVLNVVNTWTLADLSIGPVGLIDRNSVT